MNSYKYRIILFILIIIIIYNFNYISHSTFFKHPNNNIRVAFYCRSLKNGGIERVASILLNYLVKEEYFIFYVITYKPILKDEYALSNKIKRISLYNHKISLFKEIKKNEIDILIYNFYEIKEIQKLNKLKKTKVIYYNHSSYFLWIFYHIYNFKKSVYQVYKKCKYVISLIPIENDYLFKLWGINSVFINNPTTFDYDSIIPSDLSMKNIIMIGRGNDRSKRFELGILSMKYIIKEIPDCKMNIISERYKNLKDLIEISKLNEYVIITGYKKNPEPFYKNASLHIFSPVCDTYPMVIGETKIYGIPTILCGIDYLALSNEGTVIIYDNEPTTLAKEAIKILNDIEYRKKLGKAARQSMKKIDNKIIVNNWIKLLLSVYKGIDSFNFTRLFDNSHKRINENKVDVILNNQLKIFKKLDPHLREATLDDIKYYSFS